jgi:regulator of replication initiation timing
LQNILANHSYINAQALHSANATLNQLVVAQQPLYTPVWKFILYLASTTECLFAENAILKLELKKCQDMLGAKKSWAGGKQLVLKDKFIASTTEHWQNARKLCSKGTRVCKLVDHGAGHAKMLQGHQ